MTDLLSILKEWQSLAAAIVTAAAAFSVAFLVAYINRRREDTSAAMVLVGNLTTVLAANETLRSLSEIEKVSEDDYPMWLAQRLCSSGPVLSPLFDGCVSRLMPLDTNLASHLELFNVIYRSVERHSDRIIEDIEYFREHQKLRRSKADTKADAEVVRSGFAMAARHAECAERLLGLLVLSNWPTLHKMKRLVRPTGTDKECRRFLKTGAL